MDTLEVTGQDLTLENVWQVAWESRRVRFPDSARSRVDASRAFIEKFMRSGEAIYGVNTGFGALSSVRI